MINLHIHESTSKQTKNPRCSFNQQKQRIAPNYSLMTVSLSFEGKSDPIIDDTTVTVICKTAIKAMFLYNRVTFK